MTVLRTINLMKTYKQGSNYINAVDSVDFVVEKEQFVAITGASGSGKSTLLNLCAGIDKPSSGEVILDSVDISKLNSDELAEIRRNKIGFVFQQFNLLDIMTAKENIIIPSLLNNKKVDEDYFNYLVDMLGISDRLNHMPCELSGGEIQRVAIARALINKPSIIFADEPTGNLDRTTSNEIMDLFIRLHNQGNTIILVTHDLDIAKKADVVYNMSDGKINSIC